MEVCKITYIYALMDQDEIRYIGKADNPCARFKNHLKDTNDTHKTRWIQSLVRKSEAPTLKILEVINFNDWQKVEREWIAKAINLGAKLTNSTEGGRGPLNPSDESREKMRQRKIGWVQTVDHKKKVSIALRGKKKPRRTDAHKAALSASCKGKVISMEQRDKLSVKGRLCAANNLTGFKGVYFDKSRGNYQAHIYIDRKKTHLGRYSTAKDAAKAYNVAALQYGWPKDGLNIL